MVYLDYSATTPVNDEVLDTYVKVTKQFIGNPNSLHKIGIEAKKLIDASTEQIADMIVRAKTDGRNYVEVTALTETIYPVLRDTLLTTDKLYIYDILDKAALKCPNIDTERVGVVPLTGTHTVVLYVFDKD